MLNKCFKPKNKKIIAINNFTDKSATFFAAENE